MCVLNLFCMNSDVYSQQAFVTESKEMYIPTISYVIVYGFTNADLAGMSPVSTLPSLCNVTSMQPRGLCSAKQGHVKVRLPEPDSHKASPYA